jgi:uncharacterized membrane protein
VRRRQSAQVIVWVAVMVPLVFLPIVGLAMDAGAVFDARRGLQNVADGAARVGAMQLDDNVIRSRGGVQIDPPRAKAAALAYLDQMAPDAQAQISPHTESVDVSLTRSVQPKFLSLLKVAPVKVHATAQARPCTAEMPSCQ